MVPSADILMLLARAGTLAKAPGMLGDDLWIITPPLHTHRHTQTHPQTCMARGGSSLRRMCQPAARADRLPCCPLTSGPLLMPSKWSPAGKMEWGWEVPLLLFLFLRVLLPPHPSPHLSLPTSLSFPSYFLYLFRLFLSFALIQSILARVSYSKSAKVWDSQVTPWSRICLPMQETQVWSLSGEDPLEEEMATHSRIRAWETPWTEEPGELQSMELQKSHTRFSDLTTTKVWD